MACLRKGPPDLLHKPGVVKVREDKADCIDQYRDCRHIGCIRVEQAWVLYLHEELKSPHLCYVCSDFLPGVL